MAGDCCCSGVARVIETTGHMTAETGTYRWMAPEVIEHKPYDEKADVFSFGIVLWELLTCKVRMQRRACLLIYSQSWFTWHCHDSVPATDSNPFLQLAW